MTASRNVSKQDLKKSKEVASLILEAKGINYEDWLYEKHQEVEEESQEVVQQALTLLISQNKEDTNKPYFNTESNKN